MNRQLFSKRYRYFMLIATLLMLVSVVSPTFATYSNSTITYSVAVLAKCAVNSGHWSMPHAKFGNSHYTYGGSSTTYSVTFGAAATIETDSHWKSGNTLATSCLPVTLRDVGVCDIKPAPQSVSKPRPIASAIANPIRPLRKLNSEVLTSGLLARRRFVAYCAPDLWGHRLEFLPVRKPPAPDLAVVCNRVER